MIAVAHFIAIVCYAGAAALAAAPFARPARAPVARVVGALAAGLGAHAVALLLAARLLGQAPVTGFGPALSLAGLMVAATLLAAEVGTKDVTLTLIAGPLAAILTTIGAASGFPPAGEVAAAGGAWLISHIALGFFGFAALATAAAAGAMYLVERRELRSRRFGAVLRLFPPLATLDRVNHVSALAACFALTAGIALATSYSIAHDTVRVPEIVWGITAWAAATALAFGRLVGGWQARRAALASGVLFVVVVALYVAVRMNSASTGAFL